MKRLLPLILLLSLALASCERWEYESIDSGGAERDLTIEGWEQAPSDGAPLYVNGELVGDLSRSWLHVKAACNEELVMEVRNSNPIAVTVVNKCGIARCGDESVERVDNLTGVSFFLTTGKTELVGEYYDTWKEAEAIPPGESEGDFAGYGSADYRVGSCTFRLMAAGDAPAQDVPIASYSIASWTGPVRVYADGRLAGDVGNATVRFYCNEDVRLRFEWGGNSSETVVRRYCLDSNCLDNGVENLTSLTCYERGCDKLGLIFEGDVGKIISTPALCRGIDAWDADYTPSCTYVTPAMDENVIYAPPMGEPVEPGSIDLGVPQSYYDAIKGEEAEKAAALAADKGELVRNLASLTPQQMAGMSEADRITLFINANRTGVDAPWLSSRDALRARACEQDASYCPQGPVTPEAKQVPNLIMAFFLWLLSLFGVRAV
jgi:hypothetical protein